MLEDFIEANKLEARIFKGLPKEDLAKCTIYFADGEPALAISLIKDKIDEEKMCKELGAGAVERAAPKEAEEVTGYAEGEMPPISIYGVIVLIDEKVMEKGKVFVRLGEEQALEIPTSEIKEFNEGSKIADICK